MTPGREIHPSLGRPLRLSAACPILNVRHTPQLFLPDVIGSSDYVRGFALADPLQGWRMALMIAFRRFVLFAFATVSLLSLVRPTGLAAQGGGATGTIAGRVVDEDGTGVGGAQIFINQPALSTQT